jgi:hypothetical protein
MAARSTDRRAVWHVRRCNFRAAAKPIRRPACLPGAGTLPARCCVVVAPSFTVVEVPVVTTHRRLLCLWMQTCVDVIDLPSLHARLAARGYTGVQVLQLLVRVMHCRRLEHTSAPAHRRPACLPCPEVISLAAAGVYSSDARHYRHTMWLSLHHRVAQASYRLKLPSRALTRRQLRVCECTHYHAPSSPTRMQVLALVPVVVSVASALGRPRRIISLHALSHHPILPLLYPNVLSRFQTFELGAQNTQP